MPCSARARAALLIEKANERARSLPSALYFSDSPTKLAHMRARRAIEKGPALSGGARRSLARCRFNFIIP